MLGVRLKGTHLYAAEYDSTKAAIDTVEARIRNHKGRLDAICDRLTALEVRITKAPRILGPLDDELYQRVTALEAKVDAPRVSSNTWNVVSWKQCPKCGTWYCRSHNCDPPTCGNCKKAARWDSQSTFVVCYAQTSELEFRRVDTPGCSRHKRREEE